jgi:LCP family protein required for cell wall assembly
MLARPAAGQPPRQPNTPQGPAPTPSHRRKRRWSKKKIAFWILLPFVIIGVWLGIKFGYNAAKIFHGSIFDILTTTKLKGEDQGRVNILLAGNSADDVGHNGGNLTDSIMIISIDTHNHKALLLSIPRDLYVDIPDNGHAKINEAYVDGERQDFSDSGYPGGGMGLLEKTIYQTLGIKTHYYALVNYSAFRDTVNAVGGIDVNIQSSDKRGLYDPSRDYTTRGIMVKLSNGPHHLSGQQALDLARARGDAPGSYGYANSDFTRTANQRMMLLALKKKAFSTGVLANPVKLSSLSDALGKNVSSDMKLNEVKRLYSLGKDIPNNNVVSSGLNNIGGTSYVMPYRNSRGESTLIPTAGLDDYTDIRSAIHRLFSSNPVVQENAKVVVLNATDEFGLAAKNKQKIENKYMNVVAVGDATANQATSQIIDISSSTMPNTLSALKKIYGQNVTKTNPYSARFPDADFIVIIGQDKVTKSTNS